MDFSTELINLMPRRFRGVVAWRDFFQAVGEVLDDVHAKIDGLADLQDPDEVPEAYLQFLADLLGFPLTVAPATQDAYRRRWMLRGAVEVIKRKGTAQLMVDIADYLYLVMYPGVTMELYELWSDDYVDFSVDDLTVVTVPVGWTGDGVTRTFATALASTPLRVKSLRVTSVDVSDVALQVSDDGDRGLRGDATAGSVNYTTGVFTVTFTTAPKVGESVTVQYMQENSQYLTPHFLLSFPIDTYQKMGLSSECYTPSGWVGDGVTVDFATTIRGTAVVPGSVVITATDIFGFILTVYDDGLGGLYGDLGSGVNAVDYETGAIDLTFEAPVEVGGLIQLCYQYYDLYLGRSRHAALLGVLERYRPVHTVRHVEFGLPDEFWRVGVVHWRVGGPASGVPLSESIRVGGSLWA